MYKLYKLPEGFIITSDEEIKEEDVFLINNPHPNSKLKNKIKKCQFIHKNETIQPKTDNLSLTEYKKEWCKKVIAQQDQIDFSGLNEEEQKKIGYFDVENIVDNLSEKWYETKEEDRSEAYVFQYAGVENQALEDGINLGFQKAQELLSDRLFTLEDMKQCWENGNNYHKGSLITASQFNFEKTIQSLQNKSWNIELEMEYIGSNNDGSDIYEPKLNKVKILKLL